PQRIRFHDNSCRSRPSSQVSGGYSEPYTLPYNLSGQCHDSSRDPMTTVQAPPRAEFDQLAGLLHKQGTDLGQLTNYAAGPLDNTDGMDNLLSMLRSFVDTLGTFMNNKYADCASGVWLTGDKVSTVGAAYAAADSHAAGSFAKIDASVAGDFPSAI